MMAELDILNGFVGKVISDCIDITVNAIKKADKDRKSKNQTMEARIYQVTIDALNVFPYNQYKKKEQVYDAAESILSELKRRSGDKESVRTGLNMLSSEITGNICEDFLELLCYEICKVENRDLAIGNIIHQGEEVIYQQKLTNEYVQDGFKKSHQNEEEILRNVSDIKENLNSQKDYNKGENNEKLVENKAQYYAKKWNKNVFLDNYDEEDESAGDRVNVKLRDIYLEELLPPYILNENQGLSYKLKARLEKYIVDRNDRKMLLILGQPGIGKSTLITWIMANIVEKKDEIFVYQFASDLKRVNWQGEDILEEIFIALRLKDQELKNKVLILDGFDEIHISVNRERILNKLYQELYMMEYLGNFSLIITCRENYVNKSRLAGLDYITLQAWNEHQINSFCEIYVKNSSGNLEAKFPEAKRNGILKRKEIFGIPLILYMILALDISIEKNSSIVDVYDQIFSLERGKIYNRCYDKEHRINKPEIKKCIHQISQEIAYWIFENNDDEAFIYQKNFKEICDTVALEANDKSDDMQSNALIGSYFMVKHCEGELADEVNFVHRSIYEYFVVVYFFEFIHELESKEEMAGRMGDFLKYGNLSEQMLVFIKYKFDGMRKDYLSDGVRDSFSIMLRDGMTYYAKGHYRNIIKRELNIFSNMIEIMCILDLELDDNFITYLRYDYGGGLKLKGVKLRYLDLHKVYLAYSDLEKADFEGTNFKGTHLEGANLEGANLKGTHLEEAHLEGAYLKGANLEKVHLEEANLRGANLEGANLQGAHLEEAHLEEAVLEGANLQGAHLEEAHLEGANFKRACLEETHLEGAILEKLDLYGHLKVVCLERTNLRKTILSEEQVERFCATYDFYSSKVRLSQTGKIISYISYRRWKKKV